MNHCCTHNQDYEDFCVYCGPPKKLFCQGEPCTCQGPTVVYEPVKLRKFTDEHSKDTYQIVS